MPNATDVELEPLFLCIIQPVAVVLAPIPSILKVVNPPVNLTILPGPFLPISTDSAVDVVNNDPLALTAGATTLFVKVLVVKPNVNRVVPVGLSTKI